MVIDPNFGVSAWIVDMSWLKRTGIIEFWFGFPTRVTMILRHLRNGHVQPSSLKCSELSRSWRKTPRQRAPLSGQLLHRVPHNGCLHACKSPPRRCSRDVEHGSERFWLTEDPRPSWPKLRFTISFDFQFCPGRTFSFTADVPSRTRSEFQKRFTICLPGQLTPSRRVYGAFHARLYPNKLFLRALLVSALPRNYIVRFTVFEPRAVAHGVWRLLGQQVSWASINRWLGTNTSNCECTGAQQNNGCSKNKAIIFAWILRIYLA